MTFAPNFDGDKDSVFLRLIHATRMPFGKHKVTSFLLPLTRGASGFVLRLDLRKLAKLVLKAESAQNSSHSLDSVSNISKVLRERL